MYKLNVSPEHLAAFSYSAEKFKNRISNEYEQLQQKNKEFKCCIDDVTGDAFKLPIQKIGSVISKQCEELDTIIKDVNAYTDKVRMILHKVEAQRNTVKENVCGMAVGVVMHEHIKASDSDYQTMEGYMLGKTKGAIIKVGSSVIEAVTGGAHTSQLVPNDETHLDDQVDNAIKLIDGHIALRNPQKVIDRSGTKIPQEQMDAHKLVIDGANGPWKK